MSEIWLISEIWEEEHYTIEYSLSREEAEEAVKKLNESVQEYNKKVQPENFKLLKNSISELLNEYNLKDEDDIDSLDTPLKNLLNKKVLDIRDKYPIFERDIYYMVVGPIFKHEGRVYE